MSQDNRTPVEQVEQSVKELKQAIRENERQEREQGR